MAHNTTYNKGKKRRQIDVEYTDSGLLYIPKKVICECKYRESNYLDIEEVLAQILSAKRFVKSDKAILATNKNVREKDHIHKVTGIDVYDRSVLLEFDRIRGGSSLQSLESKIKNVIS